MKFLLVDDHWLFLDGLAQVLTLHLDDLEIKKCDSVASALTLIKSHQDLDLALVDLSMPNGSGIDFIAQVETLDEIIPTAVLSASDDIEKIRQAMDVGALGFIPKTYNKDELLSAIKTVLSGNIYLPEHIQHLLRQNKTDKHLTVDILAAYNITSRQLEVLSLLAKGMTNNKIAELLYISDHTVKSHLKQLFQKLNCDNRISCINEAQRIGLLNRLNLN